MADTHARRDWGAIAILSVVGVFLLLMLFWIVKSVASQGEYDEQERAESCESDYAYLLQGESYGHGADGSHLWDDFRADCGAQLAAIGEYLDARAAVRAAGNDCIGFEGRARAELLGMLETYGECDGVPLADGYEASSPPETKPATAEPDPVDDPQSIWPGGAAIAWDEAAAHAGATQRVCGPLRSVRTTGDGTFVNVGVDYPSSDRFAFVFWGMSLDMIEPDSVVCGRGEIYLYEGVVAQMEMRDPGALEIWR